VRVEFNPRSGLVACGDAVVLFVNAVEASGALAKYPNKWAQGGRQLSFFLRAHQWRGGSTALAVRLVSAGRSGKSSESGVLFGGIEGSREGTNEGSREGGSGRAGSNTGAVLLFARSGSGPASKTSPFVFCGRCAVAEAPGSGSSGQGGDLVELRLELLDFDLALHAPPFARLVAGATTAGAGPASGEVPRRDEARTACDSSDLSRYRSQATSLSSRLRDGGGLDDDALAQVDLARQVLCGDVVGACHAALDLAHVRAERRSLEAGVAALKVALARGGGNADVAAAVDALDGAAAKLGCL
jgi:hypothetical protein